MADTEKLMRKLEAEAEKADAAGIYGISLPNHEVRLLLQAVRDARREALAPISIGEWGEARKEQSIVNGWDCANRVLERRIRSLAAPQEEKTNG